MLFRLAVLPTLVLTTGLALGACGGSSSSNPDANPQGNGDGSGSAADARIEPDASPTLGTTFRFGIVGDTRPANIDGTSSYPTTIITKIYQDMAAVSPALDFAVSTGDYQFSKPNGSQGAIQLDKYLGARDAFPKAVYPALGNHECTGATTSNCGQGNADGQTVTYGAYMDKMVKPLGFTKPYYVVKFAASDNSWTAKLVFIAANAWDSTQAAWLDTTLAAPTTYTFVIRHEPNLDTTAPGVSPSKTIIARHPMTLLITGHTHTYEHIKSDHEVICGNGGAPLTSSFNYGYAVVELLAAGTLQFTEYDYTTRAMVDQFRFHADGSPAP